MRTLCHESNENKVDMTKDCMAPLKAEEASDALLKPDMPNVRLKAKVNPGSMLVFREMAAKSHSVFCITVQIGNNVVVGTGFLVRIQLRDSSELLGILTADHVVNVCDCGCV